MSPAVQPATARELQHRARFEALRGRIFGELARSSARWRLTWILPFNVLVVALLIARGESGGHAVAQCVAVAALGGLFGAQALTTRMGVKSAGFLVGIASYFTLLVTTGGLSSPLLVTGTLIIVGAAIVGPRNRWLRPTVFVACLLGFVAMAVLSRTGVGRLAAPLAPVAGWSTAEYVSVALFAAVFTMVGVFRLGCIVSRGYERAALELAERREELCTENEDRSRALEGMAARLAHEVKNPLAAIKALSTHMARNASDPKAAERLAIVAAEADRLQSIVDGFLSFSRGLDDLNLAPTRPFEVARELSVLLETRAQEAGVAIDVRGDEGLALDADPRKLRQVLLNLVLNALQASPQGARVGIAVERACEGARITVHDDGSGMTPEVLERIRKPYFTTKEGGTGLGVVVARGLVEQHGGRLEFTSSPGKGTTVVIMLPSKATPCQRLPNPSRAVEREPEAETSKPAVLGAR
ncbi:MAG TPA: HAMP domain-containing sensor histidine kinase [Polyangiaceae bacterium]|nr:HAMP domain-containing sensor histidine kinase [Polyangiaceae bacterium]